MIYISINHRSHNLQGCYESPVRVDMFELRFDAIITIQTCQIFGIAAKQCVKRTGFDKFCKKRRKMRMINLNFQIKIDIFDM